MLYILLYNFMNTDLNETLRNIGLTFKEAEIYLAALELGPSSILAISKHTHIHRTLIYQAVEKLVERGLIVKAPKKKLVLYAAIDPHDLVNYIQKKEIEVQRALPDFLAIMQSGTAHPQVTFYKGRAQLRQLYRSTLDCKSKVIWAYFPSLSMQQILGKEEMDVIIRERIRRKINLRVIRAEQWEVEFTTYQETDSALRDVRFLTPEFSPRMGLYIFDDTVCFFSPVEENYGVMVKSESFADLNRTLFENMWRNAKPFKNK